MRILIAEDDITSRLMLKRLLAQWGYQVRSVDNGDEAWRRLKEADPPHLAVLDWMMPGLDGNEVCRLTRTLETSTPTYIIMLTSLDGKEDIVRGLEAGADDYVVKPFDSNELQARLDVGRRVVELQAMLAARISELREALDHVETLQGILPICMYCHKIRNDQESWERIEHYISTRSTAEFSHGICPECAHEHFPKYFPKVE